MERFQVGFRCLPTKVELINNYLMRKVLRHTDGGIIPELEDFYARDTWELPGLYEDTIYPLSLEEETKQKLGYFPSFEGGSSVTYDTLVASQLGLTEDADQEESMEDLTEKWPVGLRFKPREDQLVDHHLRRKLRGETETICIIPELYIYKWEPQDLFSRYNALSRIPSDGHECFFFCPRDNKIPNSLRSSRKTELGFWKDTSKKRVVRAQGTGEEIGFKRILVYYEGRQGNARKTVFVMHEYHLNSNVSNSEIPRPLDFVLCRITDRECDRAGSGSSIMSTRAKFTSPSILNNSEDEGAQEISAQASATVTVEPESSNHTTLDYDLPDGNVSVPWQHDTVGMESSLCSENWQVDRISDEHDALCSPSDDVLYLSEIWGFN